MYYKDKALNVGNI